MLAEISSMYNDLENDQKAVEYMQKFVDAGDATLNDYFILSNRYKISAFLFPKVLPNVRKLPTTVSRILTLPSRVQPTRGRFTVTRLLFL